VVTRLFFGAMSPYSWFAAERIEARIPEARWTPVVAGAVFKARGSGSWGLTDQREAGMADCEARALAHGLGPIRWPDSWPTSDLLVARAMVVAERHDVLRPFALAAMRLAFLEGADLADIGAVEETGRRVGMDGEALRREVEDPETKAALRRKTEEAIALGVIGVPTVLVGEALFWGDDRLEEAARWSPGTDESGRVARS
jgi:2-hydroxychromene-2-carboxylate isomerase